eukprot:1156761-Pelagomonas_calceolata.AAC.4
MQPKENLPYHSGGKFGLCIPPQTVLCHHMLVSIHPQRFLALSPDGGSLGSCEPPQTMPCHHLGAHLIRGLAWPHRQTTPLLARRRCCCRRMRARKRTSCDALSAHAYARPEKFAFWPKAAVLLLL